MREDQRQSLIAAYLRERAALARRGIDQRVAEVDAELERLGYNPGPRQASPPRKVNRRG